jgi:hypothetical protein
MTAPDSWICFSENVYFLEGGFIEREGIQANH